jgi:hypothetical protein
MSDPANQEAPASEEPTMEIHKPHAAKTWREFFIELGTIIVGILIALSLDQLVEAIHWHHKVDDALQSLRLELREDTVPQAYTRLALQACLDRQLDDIETAIRSNREPRQISELIEHYRPPYRTWDDDAWKAALASDAGSHFGADQMIDWSKPYRIVPRLNTLNAQEHTDWIALQSAGPKGAQLSSAESDTSLGTIKRLRIDNHDLGHFSRFIMLSAERFGATMLPDQQTTLLRDLRTNYKNCVVIPSVRGFSPADQLRDLHWQ